MKTKWSKLKVNLNYSLVNLKSYKSNWNLSKSKYTKFVINAPRKRKTSKTGGDVV